MNRNCLICVGFMTSEKASVQKGDSPIPPGIMAALPTVSHTNPVHRITRIKDREAGMNREKAETTNREDLKRETMIVETMIVETTIVETKIKDRMINGTTTIDLTMEVPTEVKAMVETRMKVMAMAIDTKEVTVTTMTALITFPEENSLEIRIPTEIVIQATLGETTTVDICYG